MKGSYKARVPAGIDVASLGPGRSKKAVRAK